jgi:hypothetical protein
MSRDRIGLYMAGAAIIFAFVAQIGVFVIAGGPALGTAPVTEAMNTPAK